MADIQNGSVTISGLDVFEKKLKELETTSPGFEKRLRGAIKKVLGEVRAKMQKSAQADLGMKSDPRKAYKAVRFAVYRRLLGGQVNILPSSKTVTGGYEPPRTLRPGQRGGNRVPRGDRTKQLLQYEGISRGFVLRFLNAGTKVRYSGYGRNGKTQSDYERFVLRTGGLGHRGQIAARNWFGPKSQREMEIAAGNIQAIIDKVINDEFV